MAKRKDIHRDEKLDLYIGKNVRITFRDGKEKCGKLRYVDEFSPKYGYSLPFHYHIENLCFRKSFVRSITEV